MPSRLNGEEVLRQNLRRQNNLDSMLGSHDEGPQGLIQLGILYFA